MNEPQAPAQLDDLTPATRADLAVIHDRLDSGSHRMKSQDQKIDEITQALKANTEVTQAIYEIVEMGRAAFRFLQKVGRGFGAIGQWLFRIAKIFGTLATAALAIYAFFYAITHGGHPPK